MVKNVPSEVQEEKKSTITSTVYCVNTNHAYVYELLNGDIVSCKKIVAQ